MAHEELDFKFTDGRGGGSGAYSFRYASRKTRTVKVIHMPEDFARIRVVIECDDLQASPRLTFDETDAQLLRIALNAMAKDLKWEDV